MSDAADPSASITRYTLCESDCRQAVMRYWEWTSKENTPLERLMVFWTIVCVAMVGMTAWFYITGKYNLISLLSAAAAGFYLAQILTTAHTLKLRKRLAGEYWERVKPLGTEVSIAWVDDGIAFTRGELVQTARWLDMSCALVTASEDLWVCAIGDCFFYWVPARAFDSPEAFAAFVDEARARRDAVVPTGKGFEVLPATVSSDRQ